jgi:hypothetical protein
MVIEKIEIFILRRSLVDLVLYLRPATIAKTLILKPIQKTNVITTFRAIRHASTKNPFPLADRYRTQHAHVTDRGNVRPEKPNLCHGDQKRPHRERVRKQSQDCVEPRDHHNSWPR